MKAGMTPDKQRKMIYWVLAGIFFALILGVFVFVLKHAIAANEWVHLVADVDHRMKPHDQKFFTNGDGIRSERESSDAREEDFNVIVLGDSFMYGFLLTHKEFPPPAQLESMLREHFKRDDINVWNFGWTTSSPVLQDRLLRDIGKKYKPDVVILALDMSDYRDDYFYKHLIAGEGFYHYVKEYPRLTYIFKQILVPLDRYTGWHKQIFGYSSQYGYFVAMEPMEVNRHLFDTVYDSLNQIHTYCRDELHVPFVAFIPPRHWQYTDKESPLTWEKGSFEAKGPYALENYRYFDEKRPATGYPLVSLLDDFKSSTVYPTTFEKDSHWNKQGARLAASSMFNHLLAMGYLKPLEQVPHLSTTARGTNL